MMNKSIQDKLISEVMDFYLPKTKLTHLFPLHPFSTPIANKWVKCHVQQFY